MTAAVANYRQAPAYPRAEGDYYVEPAWCTELLLNAERFVGGVWDPACGIGTIPRVCRFRGLDAWGSDLVDRGAPDGIVRDFFADDPAGDIPAFNVITNPPYRQAEAFIRRALGIARFKVAVLVQQQFPFSQRRHALFTALPIARLYFLSDRPSMPPGEAFAAGTVEAKGGKIDYLWMVFDWDHGGPPTAHWLRRAAE